METVDKMNWYLSDKLAGSSSRGRWREITTHFLFFKLKYYQSQSSLPQFAVIVTIVNIELNENHVYEKIRYTEFDKIVEFHRVLIETRRNTKSKGAIFTNVLRVRSTAIRFFALGLVQFNRTAVCVMCENKIHLPDSPI